MKKPLKNMDTEYIETLIKEIFGEDIEIIRVKPKTSNIEDKIFVGFNRMKEDFNKAIKDIKDEENCDILGKVFGSIDCISECKHTNKKYICEYIDFVKKYKNFIDTICGRAVSRLTDTLKSLDK